VKLFAQDGELYVLAKSEGRQAKEIAMRRKKLARLLRNVWRQLLFPVALTHHFCYPARPVAS
jgi:hypothetical protein